MIIKPDYTGWKYYTDEEGVNIGIKKQNQDGSITMSLLTVPTVQEWINAGNTPEPADQGE